MSVIPRIKSENAARALALALANQACADAGPQSLSLTILERCNLACRMCDQGHSSGRMLSAEALARLEPALAGAQSVCLTGGEPLLHPDLLDFLTLCQRHQCQTIIQTNATLLTESMARRLIERGVTRLKISVDGARPETYNHIRRGADFTRVMANIRGLTRLKSALGSRKPDLEFNFVAMRSNISELPRLVRLAAGLGVSKINVFPLLAHTPELAAESCYFSPQASDEATLAAQAEARAAHITLSTPPLFDPRLSEYPSHSAQAPTSAPAQATNPNPAPAAPPSAPPPETGFQGATAPWPPEGPLPPANPAPPHSPAPAPQQAAPARRCTAPWDELTVNVDGSAALCCGGAGSAGNFNEADFAAIWNHPARQALRQRVNTPREPACCRDCRLIRQDPGRIGSHIPDPELARQALAEHGRPFSTRTPAASPTPPLPPDQEAA
jgi:MoaA/NifB/PqqE/SkfB family radical SAM enzyme